MKGLPGSLEALWTRRDDEGWHYAVQLDESHMNAHGLVHGGVLMTFIDHALSLLAWEASGRAMCSTVQLNSHFLAPVKPPAFAELDGEILKQGRTTLFVRGLLSVEGEPVMEASGMWRVIASPNS